MKVEEIMKKFKYYNGKLPKEAIEEAILQKEKITKELLKSLEYTKNNLSDIYEERDEFYGYIYAFFLLAQFREKKMLPYLIELLHQPVDVVEYILGEDFTEYLPRLIASVYDENDDAIYEIIENDEIDEFIRSGVLQTFAILYLNGIKTREFLVGYFKKLLNEKKDCDDSYLYQEIFYETYHLRLVEMKEIIKKTFYLIEDKTEIKDWNERLKDNNYIINLNRYPFKNHYYLINDVIKIMENWECFMQEEEEEFKKSRQYKMYQYVINNRKSKIVKENNNIGRNEPCHCGSGKKYKKCCMNKENHSERLQDLEFIDLLIAKSAWYEMNGKSDKAIKELNIAWSEVKWICEQEKIKTITEYDRKYEGYDFLSNWIQDYEILLEESQEEDDLLMRIDVCKELMGLFELDEYFQERCVRSIANSYFRLGETTLAENIIEEQLKKDKNWVFGYVEMADWWTYIEKEKNYEKAKSILLRALESPKLRDIDVIYERLMSIEEKLGDTKMAKYYEEKLNEVNNSIMY